MTVVPVVAGDAGACDGGAGSAKAGRSPTIGLSLDTLREERWQRDRDLFVARCQELGARVLVQAANNNEVVQNAQAENLLTQGVDVLVVAPHNSKTAATIVEATTVAIHGPTPTRRIDARTRAARVRCIAASTAR